MLMFVSGTPAISRQFLFNGHPKILKKDYRSYDFKHKGCIFVTKIFKARGTKSR